MHGIPKRFEDGSIRHTTLHEDLKVVLPEAERTDTGLHESFTATMPELADEFIKAKGAQVVLKATMGSFS